MSDLGDDIRDAIGTAIADVVSKHEGGFVTKWVAMVESVESDGTRGMWTLAPEDIKAWETLGMFQYGIQLEMARVVKTEMNE